ncbi:MAG: hypothetical protein AAFX02_03155 [Pseudomonadota bacterium]
MATFLKLMFVPVIISIMGVMALGVNGVAVSPIAIGLVLMILLISGAAFALFEARHEEAS